MSLCVEPAGRVKSRSIPLCVLVPRIHCGWAAALVSRGSANLLFALVKVRGVLAGA